MAKSVAEKKRNLRRIHDLLYQVYGDCVCPLNHDSAAFRNRELCILKINFCAFCCLEIRHSSPYFYF